MAQPVMDSSLEITQITLSENFFKYSMAGMQAITGIMSMHEEKGKPRLSIKATTIIGVEEEDEITVTYNYDVETVLNVYIYDAISQHLETVLDKFRDKMESIIDKREREEMEHSFSHFMPEGTTLQ